jgi:aspartate aminotransferase-like enzyme
MMDERCRYFNPGPVWVRPEIRKTLTGPMIGHRTQAFRDLYDGILDRLRRLFRTEQHVFVASSSGTGLMEGALLNTVARSVLVTTIGAFSERWESIASHVGIEVDHLQGEWGSTVEPGALADRFIGRRHHYDAVTITHNETSTGVMTDLELLASVVREESSDTLILVDAVSSLGGAPVEFDQWGLDVCLASTQKCLGLPPGLTVFAVSERAMECARKKTYRGTYFDFLEYHKHAASGPSTPFTPALPLFYALEAQLEYIIEEESLDERWRRHRAMRDRTIERTASFADLVCERSNASPTVSALRPRNGMTGREIVHAMRQRGYVIGSGYGQWKEETFRIGHMGDVSIDELDEMLDVLERVCR